MKCFGKGQSGHLSRVTNASLIIYCYWCKFFINIMLKDINIDNKTMHFITNKVSMSELAFLKRKDFCISILLKTTVFLLFEEIHTVTLLRVELYTYFFAVSYTHLTLPTKA